MSQRLKGFLRLSSIPKELVQTTNQGLKGVYISVSELREPSKFGATHTITIWDKEAKKAIYIADLKPDEWSDPEHVKNSPAAQMAKTDEGKDDLPF